MAPSLGSLSTHYALVIDAGSSGSRLQIYSWRDPDLERVEIIQEVHDTINQQSSGHSSPSDNKWWWPDRLAWKGKGKGKAREDELERKALRRLVRVNKGVEGEDWVKRVEPGISTQDPSDIPSYLAPLLSHALRHIPPSQHASTPIYLYATAGMRLLAPGARDAILEATCETIRSDYPFLVGSRTSAGPCGESIRVISGEEEGTWGWVAVNYLMDGFGHAPPQTIAPSGPGLGSGSGSGSGVIAGADSGSSAPLLPLSPLAEPPPDSSTESVTPVDINHHSPTFGFLDMGGASTQLAFSPTSAELVRSGYPKEDLRMVSLRLLSGEDVEWPVFVASWLGFGTNRVRERYTEQLVESWRSAQSGVASPDLETPIQDPCLPLDLMLPSSDATHPSFIGSGSFSTCLNDLRPLLDHRSSCPTSHCLFAGYPTPHIDFEREDQRGFIGISEYWYTAHQVLGLGGVWDWGEWEKGMGDFCAREWSAIEEQVERDKGWRGAAVELSRLQLQCFKGAWISNVLHDGIGIPRLVDAGGSETLTGGSVGDTNAEAERRAREKGLLASAHSNKHHFQSMDEVGSTAISWTLGKMVIEASKAVQPRSAAMENAWMGKVHGGIGQFENRLNALGIQAIWAYGFIAFGLLACLFSSVRSRRKGNNSSSGRRRKPSISTSTPLTPTDSLGWCWGASRKSSDSLYSLEDGIDLTPNKTSRTTVGRLRLWSYRLQSLVKRYAPLLPLTHNQAQVDSQRRMRHASMPLSSSSYRHLDRGNDVSPGDHYSQPASPRSSSQFFIPGRMSMGNGSLAVPGSRSGSVTPESRSAPGGLSALAMINNGNGNSNNHGNGNGINNGGVDTHTYIHSASSSPPRGKAGYALGLGTGVSSSASGIGGRPVRPRQNSANSYLSPTDKTSFGWNDPPVGMFSSSTSSSTGLGSALALQSVIHEYDDLDGGGPTSTLTPTAAAGGQGYDSVLSRQSSRVNLSEIGLAQRSSRSGTPFDS